MLPPPSTLSQQSLSVSNSNRSSKSPFLPVGRGGYSLFILIATCGQRKSFSHNRDRSAHFISPKAGYRVDSAPKYAEIQRPLGSHHRQDSQTGRLVESKSSNSPTSSQIMRKTANFTVHNRIGQHLQCRGYRIPSPMLYFLSICLMLVGSMLV